MTQRPTKMKVSMVSVPMGGGELGTPMVAEGGAPSTITSSMRSSMTTTTTTIFFQTMTCCKLPRTDPRATSCEHVESAGVLGQLACRPVGELPIVQLISLKALTCG